MFVSSILIKIAMSSKMEAFDIKLYSLEGLCDLFGIADIHAMSAQELMLCKKKVIQLHPDKNPSLPKEVFLFYKAALDRIAEIFRCINRASETQTSVASHSGDYGNVKTKIKEAKTAKEQREFNEKFNQLYEKNMDMGAQERERSRAENEWFYETPTEDTCGVKVNRVGEIAEAMESIREKSIPKEVGHGSLGLVDLTRVKELTSGGKYASSSCDSQSESVSECSEEVFGKLCYASIKRVHRDQTICPISEREVASRPKRSVNDLKALRSQKKDLYLAPSQEKEVISQWERNKLAETRNMTERQYADRLRSDEFKEKNDLILSNFLFLE